MSSKEEKKENEMDTETHYELKTEIIDNINIFQIFENMEKEYKQIEGSKYYTTSKKYILGIFQLTKIPITEKYIFSEYTIGFENDRHKLRDFYNDEGIFKCYNCGLCPSSETDNVLYISQSQNQLYSSNKTPSNIEKHIINIKNSNYVLSGNSPQYYKNHMLFFSENHENTYSIFIKKRLFVDTMTFLEKGHNDISRMSGKPNEISLIGYLNGNFGSDIHHFHLNLTNEGEKSTMNKILGIIKSGGLPPNIIYEKTSVYVVPETKDGLYQNCPSLVLFENKDAESLFVAVSDFMAPFLYKGIENIKEYFITANFFYCNNNYYCSIQIYERQKVDGNFQSNNFQVKGKNGATYNYGIFIPSFLLSSFGDIDRDILDKDTESSILSIFKNRYKNPDFIRQKINQNNINRYIDLKNRIINEISTSQPVFFKPPFEHLIIFLDEEHRKPKIPFTLDFFKGIQLDCLNPSEERCSSMVFGKYKYLLSLFINKSDKDEYEKIISSDTFKKIATYSIVSNVRKYNQQNEKPLGTYLYFKGKALQDIVKNNIDNLLLTSSEKGIKFEQSNDINLWVDYYFNRIGEASAYGTNTVVKAKDINIDFVMKIQNLSRNKSGIKVEAKENEKFSVVEKEFRNGHIINGLRDIVPNFMTTYGHFKCRSSNPFAKLKNKPSTICDGKDTDDQYGYLLLENIKNSNTLYVNLSFTDVPSTDGSEILDSIFQILLSVYIASKKIGFVHFDLHNNNVLQYDFIRNKEFLSQFPVYDKNKPIQNVYFKYYIFEGNREGVDYFIVPAKYLYILIDYGRSEINFKRTDRDVANFQDPYMFLSKLFVDIYKMKPYLLKGDTVISRLFYEYMINYIDVFRCIEDSVFYKSTGGTEVWTKLTSHEFQSAMNTEDKTQNELFFDEFFNLNLSYTEINNFFWQSIWQYVERVYNAKPENLSELEVEVFTKLKDITVDVWVKKIWDNFYKYKELTETLEDSEDIFVFNWGDVPQNTLIGIEPNNFTTAYIRNIRLENINNRGILLNKIN